MTTISIAGIPVGLTHRYSHTARLCQPYLTEEPPAFCVSATEEELRREIAEAEEPVDEAYAEAVCLHRAIAERLWQYDAFVLHSALITCDGEGYAFAARSGVGKSTHIRLWHKVFGPRVRVVNGDKPVVRMTESGPRGFGTPWNGKEGYGENTDCPLRALCFLERGAENRIARISADEAVSLLLPQVYLPNTPEGAVATLDLLDRLVDRVAFFRLACNKEEEAARVAYGTMSQIL